MRLDKQYWRPPLESVVSLRSRGSTPAKATGIAEVRHGAGLAAVEVALVCAIGGGHQTMVPSQPARIGPFGDRILVNERVNRP